MAASRSMGRTASTVGMMEGAFFVSRTDLLTWVNSVLQVNVTKVEQCANGAVYCQIIDSCAPGSVAMRKVNWLAKADHEFIPNYKLLQAAFDRNNIERHIDVDKLIRAKYQDNLEFLQWMKCYWDREGSGRTDYDPVQAREGKPVQPWARPAAGPGAAAPGAGAGLGRERASEKENLRPRAAPASREVAASKLGSCAAGGAEQAQGSNRGGAAAALPVGAVRPSSGKTPRPLSSGGSTVREGADLGLQQQRLVEELNAKINAQQEELQDLRGTLDGLERERDYYFRKLRDVEILCTTLQAQMNPDLTAEKIVADVQGILYAENEEDAAEDAPDLPREEEAALPAAQEGEVACFDQGAGAADL